MGGLDTSGLNIKALECRIWSRRRGRQPVLQLFGFGSGAKPLGSGGQKYQHRSTQFNSTVKRKFCVGNVFGLSGSGPSDHGKTRPPRVPDSTLRTKSISSYSRYGVIRSLRFPLDSIFNQSIGSGKQNKALVSRFLDPYKLPRARADLRTNETHSLRR